MNPLPTSRGKAHFHFARRRATPDGVRAAPLQTSQAPPQFLFPPAPMDGASTPPLAGETAPKHACGGPPPHPATPAPSSATPARHPPAQGEAEIGATTPRARKAVSFDFDRAAAPTLEAAVAALAIEEDGVSDDEDEDGPPVDAAQLEAAFRADGAMWRAGVRRGSRPAGRA